MHDYPCTDYIIRRMLKVIPLTDEKLIYDLNLLLDKNVESSTGSHNERRILELFKCYTK